MLNNFALGTFPSFTWYISWLLYFGTRCVLCVNKLWPSHETGAYVSSPLPFNLPVKKLVPLGRRTRNGRVGVSGGFTLSSADFKGTSGEMYRVRR